jgi:hypothetical protein
LKLIILNKDFNLIINDQHLLYSIRPWIASDAAIDRLWWITISRLPLRAWSEQCFDFFAGIFGSMVGIHLHADQFNCLFICKLTQDKKRFIIGSYPLNNKISDVQFLCLSFIMLCINCFFLFKNQFRIKRFFVGSYSFVYHVIKSINKRLNFSCLY